MRFTDQGENVSRETSFASPTNHLTQLATFLQGLFFLYTSICATSTVCIIEPIIVTSTIDLIGHLSLKPNKCILVQHKDISSPHPSDLSVA